METACDISGLRVLLVEDEGLVSMVAEDILLDAGCEVFLAARLEEAVALALADTFDVAVLDVSLGAGETSYPVAKILVERGVPVAFASGHGREAIDAEFRRFPVIQKPYNSAALSKGLSTAIAGRSS